ncbi:hypothetical protein [Bacillus mycoides]|uniref:hypothetical protein n=1 Tax=Bacillus mycoides TaxID=1405 RepID=UPI001D0D6F7B|nr:hypothetical protein [Bacillus mycoides]
MQSIVALVSDPRFVVGVLSLVGVIYTVYKTAENVKNTNDLKKELDEQTRKLTKELGDQTHKLTKELGEKNLKALEQRRYIDAISNERVKWINTMRDKFSEYLKLVHAQMNDFYKLQIQVTGRTNKDELIENVNELRERSFEITYVNNYIGLLLNPKEPFTEKLIGLQEEITKALFLSNVEGFKYEHLEQLVKDLSYFYQVILKAEWKRVKEENKKGEEIDDDAMNNIYIIIAEKLDEDVYNKYFSQSES